MRSANEDAMLVQPSKRVLAIQALTNFSGVSVSKALDIDRRLNERLSASPAAYTNEIRRLTFNLASNSSLLDVPAERLLTLTDAQMAEGTVVERIQIQERERHDTHLAMLRERQAATNPSAQESLLNCRKCKSADLQFIQKQLRAADEPMTCFFTCNSCKHRWRIS